MPKEDEDAAVTLFQQLRRRPYPEEPYLVDFTSEAKAVFATWVNENAALIGTTNGLAAGFFAKYPGQCARIALSLHCLHHPADLYRELDAATVRAAIAVMEYFRAHLSRVLPAFGASSPPVHAGLAVRVTGLLQRSSETWVSRTELHRGLGGTVTAEDLTSALAILRAQGLAEHRSVTTGARSREEWHWTGEAPDADVSTRFEEHEDRWVTPGLGSNSSYLHNSSVPQSPTVNADADADALVQETFL